VQGPWARHIADGSLRFKLNSRHVVDLHGPATCMSCVMLWRWLDVASLSQAFVGIVRIAATGP
jgi:hypothetical protein